MTRPSSSRARAAARALIVLFAVTLAAAGCKKGAQGGFSMPPMPVETAVVAPRNVADRFDAVGAVEAGEAITVVSEIDASIKSLPFREGQPVAKGALLAQLDDETASAELKRAEALLDQSQTTYNRVKALYDQKAAAPQDLDDADAARKVAEANVRLARERLRKTRVTAPFAGLVGAKRVSAGAFVRAGEAITQLASLHEVKITFSAPERYLSTLQRGREVSVSTTAYPGYELHGRIDVVSPVLDPETRAAQIIARVRNPGGKFRPGMSASVSVVLSERAQALTVPSEAVFSEGGQTLVYVVKADSTVERTVLTLGTRQADVVEVVQGLTAGARVVTAGHQKLFPGAKVIPTESGAAAGGPGGPGGGAAAAGGEKVATTKTTATTTTTEKTAAKSGEKK